MNRYNRYVGYLAALVAAGCGLGVGPDDTNYSSGQPCEGAEFSEFSDKKYMFCPSKQTWEQAEVQCQRMGEAWHLVTFSDDEETAHVGGLSAKLLWTGHNDRETEGTWLAFDQPTEYSDWDNYLGRHQQPNGTETNEQDCVRLHKNTRKWHDANCENKYAFVCEGPIENESVDPDPEPPAPLGVVSFGPTTQSFTAADFHFVKQMGGWHSETTIGPAEIEVEFENALADPQGDEVTVTDSGGTIIATAALKVEGNRLLWKGEQGFKPETSYQISVAGVVAENGAAALAEALTWELAVPEAPVTNNAYAKQEHHGTDYAGSLRAATFAYFLDLGGEVSSKVKVTNASGEEIPHSKRLFSAYGLSGHIIYYLRLDPQVKFEPGTKYFLHVLEGIQKEDGTTFVPVTYPFETDPAEEVLVSMEPTKVLVSSVDHTRYEIEPVKADGTDHLVVKSIMSVNIQFGSTVGGRGHLAIKRADGSAVPGKHDFGLRGFRENWVRYQSLFSPVVWKPGITEPGDYRVTLTGVKDWNDNVAEPLTFTVTVDPNLAP